MRLNNPTLLIDADIIIYQICFSNTHETIFEDPISGEIQLLPYSNPKDLYSGADTYLASLREKLDAGKMLLILSDKENFRKDILPSYKAHRKLVAKPMGMSYLRKYLEENYECMTKPRLEADDVLGILSTKDTPKLGSNPKVIVSIDKDFDSVPGYVYNPMKDYRPRLIGQEEADYNFFKQGLMGDKTDGYFGCPSIGEVTACKVLDKALKDKIPLYDAVIAQYKKKDIDEEEALVQLRCARILRDEDYDYKTGEVKLWVNG